MKKLTLSIKDRLLVTALFACNEDTHTEALVQRSIIKTVVIGDEEQKEIGLKTGDNNQIAWNPRTGLDKDFEFSAEQYCYLKESLYALSKGRKVTQNILPLCEKIQAW